ncbi:pH-response regulator protein palF/prr-3 [Naviculisporaceae sp. PSN 640]
MGPSRTAADNSPAASAATASIKSSIEESSPSRSFFSRLSLLPLRSRTRNVADFYIRPAEPHRKYGAGDHVQGAVILTVVKPVRITHLTVALHGYVRVSKGPSLSLNDPVTPAEIPSRGARPKHQGGYASLFQDEQVLSSDGRLDIGRYEFNFDLLFPSKGLPSSIDFERGTISYVITATLTRPTSISPTTSCETKIYLVEKVDVGSLSPPRPHTIYLEPISKRTKKKKPPGVEKGSATSETPEPASDLDSTRANENSTEGSLSVIGEDLGNDPYSNNQRSPSQIETPLQSDMRSVSGDSVASVSTGPSRPDDPIQVVYSNAGKRRHVVEDRTITATIELLKGGCIAGDIVSVKVSVQHIKRIKSMHGVIVTLYRQGRIDSAPSPLLFRNLSKEDARRLEKEEYYPKSKTGLGGLSLSSAGTCSVFRKDLSQAFSPLIIDPATLSASVTTSVRVPEDAFPTIKGVPGEMISFKYQIEVIVDLGGKLANQLQRGKTTGPRIGATTAPVGPVNNPYEGGVALASWGTSIIDTDRLRREKGVISVVDEVVVGTVDSSRLRGKSLSKLVPSITAPSVAEQRLSGGGNFGKGLYEEPPEDEGYPQTGYVHQHDYATYPHQPHPPQHYPYWNSAPSQPPPPPPPQISAPHYVPPPEIPDEQNLSEKERVRRAEQRLLPSQPGEPSGVAGPSEPPLAPLPINGSAYNHTPSAPPLELADPVLMGPPIFHPPEPPLDVPSAPPVGDLSPPGHEGVPVPATEDKQELERRRLLAEASAPPEFPDDYDDGGVGSSSAPPPTVPTLAEAPPASAFEPSAPVLVDDDEADYGAHYTYAHASGSNGLSSSALPGSGVTGVGGSGPVVGGAGPGGIEPLPRYER